MTLTPKYLCAASVGIAAGAAILLYVHARAVPYRFNYEHVLGTSMDMTVVASSQQAANAAAAAVLDRIDRDAKILSGYDPGSEFSRWFQTRGQAVPVSAELFDVLALFDTWRDRTGGALDASAEAVSRVWKRAATLERVPTDEELAAAVAEVRRPHWRLDPSARTVTHLDATPIILNSFTKSYIIDRAVRAARGRSRSPSPIRWTTPTTRRR